MVERDDDLELAVTVTNDTDADVPAGTVDLDIFRSVSTRDVLADWLNDTSTTGYLGAPMDSVDVPAVPAHRSVTLGSVKIVSGNVALGGYSSFGARRIAAEYTAGDTYAVARSAITWDPDSADQTPVGVSVAMPITMPKTGDGVLGAGVLAAATAVDGTLTQQLDAAEDHNVAVAVDPRIIASIRLLGEDAPSSATAWLTRLESLRNETFASRTRTPTSRGCARRGRPGSCRRSPSTKRSRPTTSPAPRRRRRRPRTIPRRPRRAPPRRRHRPTPAPPTLVTAPPTTARRTRCRRRRRSSTSRTRWTRSRGPPTAP
ncbi:DUF6049 family protein [Curtobacterium flaccumfaciens]|nr:DUF6049 family protein [Curtobacterium flaccumfaciens]